ncbi:ChaN family lipoprotein [Neolewinella aurantiaca]|uniref:ChaN family lipoprotein n=1 Tax=Neolewinella aurantiaca TaxID=2602767 RepID=A0A5C7FN33_9BACT|nr:ChaN family lipoprotein [Neolewinella aurantiaca]TXF91605.1 ChaN family lipoprotein [Neolewinella aurantiaca]
MRRIFLSILLLTIMSAALTAQSDPSPYALFNQDGKQTKFKKLVKEARKADVILFGESHNDAVVHWLQYNLALHLRAAAPLSIGMEMFESDQQAVLNDYLAGKVEASAIDSVGEGLWNNFKTDYKPVVDWAAQNDVAVIATNVPRRYARVVFKGGLDALNDLPAEEKQFLPTLPVPYDATLPGYVKMLEMMPGGHGGETFPMAQAIKDATMAHFIVVNKKEGVPFLHLNGSYHSNDYEGIGWYLKKYAPELKVLTITTIEESDPSTLSAENRGKADFTIVVSEFLGKTY